MVLILLLSFLYFILLFINNLIGPTFNRLRTNVDSTCKVSKLYNSCVTCCTTAGYKLASQAHKFGNYSKVNGCAAERLLVSISHSMN